MHLDKTCKHSNIEAFLPVKDDKGIIVGAQIRFTAIKYAIKAAAQFSSDYGFYKDCSVKWGGDPCERLLNADAGVFGSKTKAPKKMKKSQDKHETAVVETEPAVEPEQVDKMEEADEVAQTGFMEPETSHAHQHDEETEEGGLGKGAVECADDDEGYGSTSPDSLKPEVAKVFPEETGAAEASIQQVREEDVLLNSDLTDGP